jgi:hypothetical protein
MVAAGLFLAFASCDDDLGPAGPEGPGILAVDLLSPFGSEGSAVFQVTGGASLGAVTVSGGEVYHEHGLEGSRVVVVLDAPGAIRFRVATSDLGDLPTVTVIQVADGNDQLRDFLSGYTVEVVALEEGGAE